MEYLSTQCTQKSIVAQNTIPHEEPHSHENHDSQGFPSFTEIEYLGENQPAFGKIRVQWISHSPKLGVRRRHVKRFESTYQIWWISMEHSCTPLFVHEFVSGGRLEDLELAQERSKEGRYAVLGTPEITAHLHVPTSRSHTRS